MRAPLRLSVPLLSLKQLVDIYEILLRRHVAECYLDAKLCNPVRSTILNCG